MPCNPFTFTLNAPPLAESVCPIVGDERLCAANVFRRQVNDDFLRAAVDERDGTGVFGLAAERVPSAFVFANYAEHISAGRKIDAIRRF